MDLQSLDTRLKAIENPQKKPEVTKSVGNKEEGVFSRIQVGADNRIFRADQDGIYAGGQTMETAPWRLDFNGKMTLGPNGEIVIDPTQKKIIVGTAGEIVIDATTKTITAGTAGEVVIDGVLGQIRTNNILDQTYGLYGTFAKQITTSEFVNDIDLVIGPISGGLMTVRAMIIDTNLPGFTDLMVDLPGLETTTGVGFWFIYKDAGQYKIRHRGSNIGVRFANWERVMYTIFFNSNEAAASY